MKIVRPSQWMPQPWRNGGGVTHELWREGPPDAFEVRVSVADVTREGPFSRFAGVERWITMLEGRGFTLHRGEQHHTIDAPFTVFPFAGEDAIDCSLVDGPVRDLNVMVARSRWRADVRAVAVDGSIARAPGSGTRTILFVLEGALAIDDVAIARHELAVDVAPTARVAGRGRALVVALDAV